MTTGLLRLRALAVLIGCATSFGLHAQESAMAFEDGCSRQSPDEMRPFVIEKLGAFESALAQGDLQRAQTAKSEAEGATQDIAGWTGALGMKCLDDQALYRRYFVNSQALWRLQAMANPQDIASRVSAALWDSIENGGTAIEVLSGIPDDHRSYRSARDSLDRAAATVSSHRDAGAFVIAEEVSLERQALQTVELIESHASQHARDTLSKEAEVFYREATEFEKEGAQTIENLSEFAGAMAGVEMNATEQAEYQLAHQRIRESREQLEQARGWEFVANSPAASPEANRRAAERGDEVIAWAGNESSSFTNRDEYYELALAYFNWCECEDKSTQAVAAKAAIQPQLEAEKARRQAEVDAARSQLENKAAEMQRALDDMQKTEAEKKAFDEEADALEDELGF